ncbi:MAG TPA: cytochrome P450 [Acidimicrobiales bacterium]
MTSTAEPVLFDPADPELRRDPYPTYRRMREVAPAWRSPTGIWYFTRYADSFELFRSPALSYDSTATAAYQASLSSDPEERARQLEETRRNRSLLDVDPPEHTRLRSLINRAFTAPVVEAARPRIVGFVDQLMDAFEGPVVDLVGAYGSLLPIIVICDMMGVDPAERHEFLDIGHAVARSVDPDVPLEEKLAANQRMRTYIGGLLDARRATPGDDLTTRLIQAAADGRVTEEELVINTGILLVAGFETTTNLITNAVYRLVTHPDQLARLRAEPGLIKSAIEEVLRFDPPSQFMRPRTIIAEVEVGGARLHPGDPVVPLIAAANRDPEEFPDPDTFDIGRTPNRHFSFGVGPHLCVGAALARMEAQIAVERLFDRYPNLSLVDEELEYRPNLQLRGFAKLNARLG